MNQSNDAFGWNMKSHMKSTECFAFELEYTVHSPALKWGSKATRGSFSPTVKVTTPALVAPPPFVPAPFSLHKGTDSQTYEAF